MGSRNDSFMSRKSFVETLVYDAFNPGIRQQSFDMINYVVIAIIACSIIAVYMRVASYYLLGLIIIAGGFVFLVNKYKDSFLEATAIYDKMQQEELNKSMEKDEDYEEDEYEFEDEEYEDNLEDNTMSESSTNIALQDKKSD